MVKWSLTIAHMAALKHKPLLVSTKTTLVSLCPHIINYCTSVYSPRPSQTAPSSSPGSSRCPTREEDRVTTQHNNQTVSRPDMAQDPCPHLLLVPVLPGGPHRVPQPTLHPPPVLHLAPLQLLAPDPLQNLNPSKNKGIVTKIFVYLLLVVLQLHLLLPGPLELILHLSGLPLNLEIVPPPIFFIHNSSIIRHLSYQSSSNISHLIIHHSHLFYHHQLLFRV